jgi:hypothetical protein
MNELCTEFVECDLGRGNSGVVKLPKNPAGCFTAVKTATIPEAIGSLHRQINSLKMLSYPLIVWIHESSSRDVVVTALSENGSLANHFRDCPYNALYSFP